MHFPAPSEHTIDGVAAAAEFQLVHADEDGNLLVVGILASEGAHSEGWQPFIDGVAAKTADIALDVATVLPADRAHYAYTGSLSTPPCSENVQWIVLSTPVELDAAQLATLETASHHNARPTQPLGDRVISGGTGLFE